MRTVILYDKMAGGLQFSSHLRKTTVVVWRLGKIHSRAARERTFRLAAKVVTHNKVQHFSSDASAVMNDAPLKSLKDNKAKFRRCPETFFFFDCSRLLVCLACLLQTSQVW